MSYESTPEPTTPIKLDAADSQIEPPVISTEPYKNVTYQKSIDFTSINEILIKVFKHDGFRTDLQRDAVIEACKFNRDLFVSLPTGSGKSLIYQLPAVFKNYGLVVVVSPLVALISNQISNAKKLGIPCATINSHMSKTWNMQVKAELKNKNTKLRILYITPETLCSDHFQPYLTWMNKNKTLKLFAIDEAHCVSSWGHEFRPDYLKLRQLRTQYPSVPILALTATATTKVLNDILDVLNLRDPRRIVASAFRKNLFYDVIDADELEHGLLKNLTEFLTDCLKIKKKRKSTPNDLSTRDSAKKSKKPSNIIDSKSIGSASGSQFVSAAALLSAQALLPPDDSKISVKKIPKKEPAKILVPEAAKITSFFKSKQIEVVDLCDEDDDEVGDCVEVLNEKSTTKLKSSMKTTNIHRSTDDKTQAHGHTESDCSRPKSRGVGIVYCRTKVNCEDVSAHLNLKGIPSRPYHSSLTAKQRAEIEQLWMGEKVLVICATISFGMGIDKANVRVVVHFNMSQSLANYYQESGRAGRDGKEANCRLYYSKSDHSAITFLLRKDMELETKDECVEALGPDLCKRKKQTAQAAMERFERMVGYCKSNNKCRHLVLAREFALADESPNLLINGCGKSCDYCLGTRTKRTKPSSGFSATSSRSSTLSSRHRRLAASMASLAAASSSSSGGKSFLSAALIG